MKFFASVIIVLQLIILGTLLDVDRQARAAAVSADDAQSSISDTLNAVNSADSDASDAKDEASDAKDAASSAEDAATNAGSEVSDLADGLRDGGISVTCQQ